MAGTHSEGWEKNGKDEGKGRGKEIGTEGALADPVPAECKALCNWRKALICISLMRLSLRNWLYGEAEL